jgi:hypothetical protein
MDIIFRNEPKVMKYHKDSLMIKLFSRESRINNI